MKRAVATLEMAVPLAALALVWQGLAQSGLFPPLLIPPIPDIGREAWRLIVSGILLHHLAASLFRVVVGVTIGSIVGVALGLAMGLSVRAERFFLPIVNMLLPIPSIALVPLFVLWFGLGSTAVILLVAFVASLQVIFNTWTGVKSADVKLLRVGQSMNAPRWMLIWRIIVPSALPLILTGLRLAFARGWIGTVAGELVAGTQWGLGWMIFSALQFLKTPSMLVGLVTIGLVGLAVEKLVFQPLEARTVVRWGMLQES